MQYALVIESTAYFPALINPASTIFLLSTMAPPSTLIAFLIFMVRLTAVRRGRFYEDTAINSGSALDRPLPKPQFRIELTYMRNRHSIESIS
jgi:hypothetical protein